MAAQGLQSRWPDLGAHPAHYALYLLPRTEAQEGGVTPEVQRVSREAAIPNQACWTQTSSPAARITPLLKRPDLLALSLKPQGIKPA